MRTVRDIAVMIVVSTVLAVGFIALFREFIQQPPDDDALRLKVTELTAKLEACEKYCDRAKDTGRPQEQRDLGPNVDASVDQGHEGTPTSPKRQIGQKEAPDRQQ